MTFFTAAVATLSISATALAASAGRPPASCHDDQFNGRSFAIYALSIGRGVPDETYAFYNSSKARLEGMQNRGLILHLSDTPIGIEGERRLCAEFADTGVAKRTWTDLCESLHEVPLLNLEIEECPQDPQIPELALPTEGETHEKSPYADTYCCRRVDRHPAPDRRRRNSDV